MNVLLVSQCDKRALVETRRVLDQFAERKGARTWQTPITAAGLTTLRIMLRRSARKNTSVACHWIRGMDHTELMWVVGDAKRFNAVGTVPTNMTESDVLRDNDENQWTTAEDIRLLTELAALFHDFGKASKQFQKKLTAGKPLRDAYRHEWVSLKLFEAFVDGRPDREWLEELAAGSSQRKLDLGLVLEGDESPFAKLKTSPVAMAVGWLVLSHHRLPFPAKGSNEIPPPNALGRLPLPIGYAWSYPDADALPAEKALCAQFKFGTPLASVSWRAHASKVAAGALMRPRLFEPDSIVHCHDPFAMLIGRASLMLADHHYSSLPSDSSYGDKAHKLFANTDRETKKLKQRLDEHLIGVAVHAGKVIRSLVNRDKKLPNLGNYAAFRRRSQNERFRWQDKAYDAAAGLRESSLDCGFFGINMASTGCGKTLANARIMYALADAKRGARFTIALGLRTLTLQTGKAYRERLRLKEDELAVMVGGSAVRELFNLDDAKLEGIATGSESQSSLLASDTSIFYEGSLNDGPLYQWLKADARVQKMVYAPVLACTIDHIMPACEATRGGHQIAPALRLLTADLVLDEPDDFDLADLPALSRLVYTAATLGARVLLSSATLPPAMVDGLYRAYQKGRGTFQRHCRPHVRQDTPIPCVWFDEFETTTVMCNVGNFTAAHSEFVQRRIKRLGDQPLRRNVEIVPFAADAGNRSEAAEKLAKALPAWIDRLHLHNHTELQVGLVTKRVSFGLVRMANVDPIIDVARAMFLGGERRPRDPIIHLCVYHARHPLLMRSAIERLLDRTLKREQPLDISTLPEVRTALESSPEATDHVFVVLASPVAEVGRDHDYDWAIVEPSSMRSLIQLAGRIRRHRPEAFAETNVLLIEHNLKAVSRLRPAFEKPGFEDKKHLLANYSLYQLLNDAEISRLDASTRVASRPSLKPNSNLSDLEHARLGSLFEPFRGALNASVAWETYAHLSGYLQGFQRFRQSEPTTTYSFLYDEQSDNVTLASDDRDGKTFKNGDWAEFDLCQTIDVTESPWVRHWGVSNYITELHRLAQELQREDIARVAERFGVVQLSDRDALKGWLYHPAMGFRRANG